MIQQVEITLKPKSRGFHLVTNEILSQLPKLPLTGIMNIFCKQYILQAYQLRTEHQ